jgi:hypothetical protein
LLTRFEQSGITDRRIRVISTPQEYVCSDPPGSIDRVCCTTTSVAVSRQFQIPSTSYSFGMAFADSGEEYRIEQFEVLSAFEFSTGSTFD